MPVGTNSLGSSERPRCNPSSRVRGLEVGKGTDTAMWHGAARDQARRGSHAAIQRYGVSYDSVSKREVILQKPVKEQLVT